MTGSGAHTGAAGWGSGRLPASSQKQSMRALCSRVGQGKGLLTKSLLQGLSLSDHRKRLTSAPSV